MYTAVYTGVPMGSTYTHYDSHTVSTYTRAHGRRTAVYMAAYGPYTRPCRRPVHGRVKAGYTTCVHVYTAVTQPCTGRVRTVYTARTRPCTPPAVYTARVQMYTCTRPLHGNVHSGYGPRTRPSTGCVAPC